jgi:RNA polymerase sigma-70 factor (ECF subfamily)
MGLPIADDQGGDVLLIQALQNGNQEVLDELVIRHDRWVRGVVFAVLGDASQVDDVAQRVWMAVWRRIGSLDDPRRWRYWLYRLARNAAIDAGRRRQRQRGLWRRLVEQASPSAADHRNPLNQAMLSEEHGRAMQAIGTMPAIYREPFVLRHLEDWTYRQIAEVLNLPIDTVGTRLVRARHMLQRELDNNKRPE